MEIVSLDLIDEFLKEIEIGRVETIDRIYYIKIHVNSLEKNNDDLIPVLKIPDKEKFRLKIDEYIKKILELSNKKIKIDRDFIKDSMAHLFANATFTDLSKPEIFIDKYINFMDMDIPVVDNINGIFDDVVNDSDIAYNSTLVGKIEKQSSFQETPYVFKSSIQKDPDSKYNLPGISFGISDNICYIYAIKNDKVEENNLEYNKRIKRLLYKLDNHVKENESLEYIEYKNNNINYYPENITDVVPSAILSLSFFLTTLYDYGISKVKIVSFLPVRYNAKKTSFEYITKRRIDKENLNIEESKKLIKQSENEHLRIQNNLTNKLIRNFNRLNFHFSNIEIVSYPFEQDEFLNMSINPFEKTNNVILERIINKDIKKKK